jgi:hypothetical protein
MNEKNASYTVDFIEADILQHGLTGEFDLAVCMGNSFGYFP